MTIESDYPKGFCLASACPNLQTFVKDVSETSDRVFVNPEMTTDNIESGEIADCMLKDGCAAEAYTSGKVDLAVMILNAGKFAEGNRRGTHA